MIMVWRDDAGARFPGLRVVPRMGGVCPSQDGSLAVPQCSMDLGESHGNVFRRARPLLRGAHARPAAPASGFHEQRPYCGPQPESSRASPLSSEASRDIAYQQTMRRAYDPFTALTQSTRSSPPPEVRADRWQVFGLVVPGVTPTSGFRFPDLSSAL